MKKIYIFISTLIVSITSFAQSQFASSVISFSTEWSTSSWQATQTLGAPNTVGCGDITTAWASASADGQREFLVLGFTTPQQVNNINVYETYNPGAIDTIFLRNSSNGQWNIIYTATAASATPCPRTFSHSFTQTTYTVDAIRLAINSPAVASWNEIDAVEIQNNCSTLITTANNPVNCFGDCNALAVAVPSGQSPYTYSWTTSPVQTTPNATGLCAGTYTVFVTDATGCVSSANVTITQPTQLVCAVGSVSPSNCGNPDGQACILVTGGTPPYTYQWSPNGATSSCTTGLVAGIYTCTVTDSHGCTCSSVVVIPNQSGPVITSPTIINPSCQTCCDGSATVNFSGGTGPYTYSWYFPSQTTQTATGLCAQCYTVVVTDANGCMAADVVCLNFSVGTNEIENEMSVSVYPNPSNGNFTIELGKISEGTFEVINMLGEKVFQSTISNQKSVIDLSSQPKGIYFLRIRSAKGVLTKKIIKK